MRKAALRVAIRMGHALGMLSDVLSIVVAICASLACVSWKSASVWLNMRRVVARTRASSETRGDSVAFFMTSVVAYRLPACFFKIAVAWVLCEEEVLSNAAVQRWCLAGM